MSVEKQPGVDTVHLSREVEQALADITKTLPDGIKADNILFRQADFIETSINNVQKVLLEAVVVVAIVLFAFLLNVRTTAISLTAIPVSILVTAIIFHLMGLSINTMTLGGLAIAIGELVDDAVVDVENIFRRLRENREKEIREAFSMSSCPASQEVRSGIVYATMIIVLVFVPLFALSGIEGRLFAPLGQAYIVSILASLLVSITLDAGHGLLHAPRAQATRRREGFIVRVLKRAMQPTRLVIRASEDADGGRSCGCSSRLGPLPPSFPRSFLPPFNEGTLTISMLFNPGISLAESHRVGLIAERFDHGVPEVKLVGRRTGRAELDEHAEGVHSSEIDVDLISGGRDKNVIVNDIRARLAVLPVTVNMGQPISHRLDHMLSGVRAQIALKIFGEDIDTNRALAEEFRRKLSSVPGIVDLQVEKQVRIPQLEVVVDYRRAALYGLQPSAVTEQLERLSNGRIVSRVVDGNRRFDVVVRLDDQRRTTQGLGDLLIETPSWVDSGAPDRRHRRSRRAEPDPPRECQAPSRGSRQYRWLPPTWRRSLRTSAGSSRTRSCQPASSQVSKDVPGEGGVDAHHRPSLARIAGDGVRHSL